MCKCERRTESNSVHVHVRFFLCLIRSEPVSACAYVCVYAFVRVRVRNVGVYWRITAWLMPNLKLSKQMAWNWVDTGMKNRAALYKHLCCVCSPAASKDWHRLGSRVSACIDKIFSRGLVGHWRTGKGWGERVRRKTFGGDTKEILSNKRRRN